MAEDTEKKFQSIMEKLFQSRKSNLPLSSSSLSVQKIRGQKRPLSAIESNLNGDKVEEVLNAAHAPPCRPWVRGDLMRRVATFKSMRWFAKPKAMDAMNCARRGWVNVDMDIIACEVCGARLQFSCPTTWSQQQVEKTALVFSLKLDSGHKMLCPWIDNACDENLALFPPLPTPLLVDRYKERSVSLLQLSALPIVSASAIESMKTPAIEHFLKQSIAGECGAEPNGSSSWTEYLGNDVEAVSANLYYQAHRLLSLCGWETRLLPYVVDSGEQPKQTDSNKNPSDLSHIPAGEKIGKLCVYISGPGESRKENEDPVAPVAHYDPNSTVLDCKLCGASIGLWSFITVPRPLELIRVIGHTDVDSRRNHENKISTVKNYGNNENSDLSTVNKESTLSRETSFKFSIAGGPPATKQNFRATISVPVVGRNVRARFSCESSAIRNTSKEGDSSCSAVVECPVNIMQSLETGSGDSDNLPPIKDTGKPNQAPIHLDSTTVGVSDTVSQEDVGVLSENAALGEFSPSIVDYNSNPQNRPADDVVLRKDSASTASANQKENGLEITADMSVKKDVSISSIETDLGGQSSDKKMEFHPIRQHRHFCPWVASTGTTASGWQQTLLALHKEKVVVLPETDVFTSSPSLIKVDDPITSIRELFKSPAKKLKPTAT